MKAQTPRLPSHLKKYLVEQDYSRYTAIDQAVWRFIMRRLKHYLSKNAHECYAEGLAKTGISTEYIPKIEEMSEKLTEFGWRAVAVSGFIPPAAFMELQSLGILPIACDMRTLEHAMYTPAPDIVHEAAGHAPILIHPEFANYLKEYAQVARRAILNKADLNVYSAIRVLSDLKEKPDATDEEIQAANLHLEGTVNTAGDPSEAALLARMNWWTAEYGLIGPLDSPKIYGAGLLSSVGESYTALLPKTKKIPFSLDCLGFSYDITEPQPQLFVTPDFATLTNALRDMADRMAYKKGGVEGLKIAQKAETVNSIQLDSGIQISGQLKNFRKTASGEVSYLQLTGPSQLCFQEKELPEQGTARHPQGFGTPLGPLKNGIKLGHIAPSQLGSLGIELSKPSLLEFGSGVVVKGVPFAYVERDSRILIIQWREVEVQLNGEVLFDRSWGEFDMAVGDKVVTVFGGAADREAFGDSDAFEVKHVPTHSHPPEFIALNEIYSRIRSLRGKISAGITPDSIEDLLNRLDKDFPNDWLSRLELYEICKKTRNQPKSFLKLQQFLTNLAGQTHSEGMSVRDGLSLIDSGI